MLSISIRRIFVPVLLVFLMVFCANHAHAKIRFAAPQIFVSENNADDFLVADFNRDSLADIAVIETIPGKLSIMLNKIDFGAARRYTHTQNKYRSEVWLFVVKIITN